MNNYLRITGSKGKVNIVLNAASSESFERVNTDTFIEKYNLTGKKIILCVGNLNEAKRQDLLIEVLPQIITEVPDAFLLLVGVDGGYLEKVKAAALRLKMDGYYKYLGPVSDEEKNQSFDSAKIFTLFSDKDHYPLAIAEAMAHHLPVVATDARGPLAMIHNGVDGFIIKKSDVNGMATAVLKLLKDDNLRKQMSKNARINAEKNHSVSGIVDQLEEIYYDILHKKKKITA